MNSDFGGGGLEETRFERWASSIRRFTCSLRGHDELFKFEKDRLSLLCVSCGHETLGWDLKRPKSTPLGKAA